MPTGGLNLWARLPDGTDVDQFVGDCEAAGVIIAAGTEWFPAEPAGPFIRLNFAGPNPGAFRKARESSARCSSAPPGGSRPPPRYAGVSSASGAASVTRPCTERASPALSVTRASA